MIKNVRVNCCQVEGCETQVEKKYNFCEKHCKHIHIKNGTWNNYVSVFCKDCPTEATQIFANNLGEFVINLLIERGE